ncbi:Putative chromo/chromo shadow domain, Chromo-like domain superfamily protein [Septoria linicola]|uniref:Chromo/chromo shadow domain, Chromo-like domain superfamily protein n=1 Tax=Septoria linicola TaxID=215465 RepID=A0A9Q9AMG8_9PEZI|nr:Putative chromo/chromo shadow domain, Chromo-like domain superfamily protein [Septoria linicola]
MARIRKSSPPGKLTASARITAGATNRKNPSRKAAQKKTGFNRPAAVDEDEDGTPIYRVERIIDTNTKKDFQYKVLWEGYPEDEATSETIDDLEASMDLVNA